MTGAQKQRQGRLHNFCGPRKFLAVSLCLFLVFAQTWTHAGKTDADANADSKDKDKEKEVSHSKMSVHVNAKGQLHAYAKSRTGMLAHGTTCEDGRTAFCHCPASIEAKHPALCRNIIQQCKQVHIILHVTTIINAHTLIEPFQLAQLVSLFFYRLRFSLYLYTNLDTLSLYS